MGKGLAALRPTLTIPPVLPMYYLKIGGNTMSTTVTSKGQVTIPKPVRDRLNLKPGCKVDFELAPDGRVVLIKAGKKAGTPKSRFESIRGILKTDMTTDEIMALLRGDPAEV
jgi:AbrB family looped-hinge helix DNA binding protein